MLFVCLQVFVCLPLQRVHSTVAGTTLAFFFFFNLFIYFWLRWVFLTVRGLSLVATSRGYSLLRCTGSSLRWLLLLRSTGSRREGFSSCGSRALDRRLSSCGARAQLLRGMWDLAGPGLEPMSPALGGGFSTTVPPGKPHTGLSLVSPTLGMVPGTWYVLNKYVLQLSFLSSCAVETSYQVFLF